MVLQWQEEEEKTLCLSAVMVLQWQEEEEKSSVCLQLWFCSDRKSMLSLQLLFSTDLQILSTLGGKRRCLQLLVCTDKTLLCLHFLLYIDKKTPLSAVTARTLLENPALSCYCVSPTERNKTYVQSAVIVLHRQIGKRNPGPWQEKTRDAASWGAASLCSWLRLPLKRRLSLEVSYGAHRDGTSEVSYGNVPLCAP